MMLRPSIPELDIACSPMQIAWLTRKSSGAPSDCTAAWIMHWSVASLPITLAETIKIVWKPPLKCALLVKLFHISTLSRNYLLIISNLHYLSTKFKRYCANTADLTSEQLTHTHVIDLSWFFQQSGPLFCPIFLFKTLFSSESNCIDAVSFLPWGTCEARCIWFEVLFHRIVIFR